MSAGFSHRTKRDPTAFLMAFYFRMKAAWVLWRHRKKAKLPAHDAASRIGIDAWELRRYELGIENPPLQTIQRLLTQYNAEESTIFFFCTISLPSSGNFEKREISMGAAEY